ncbi:hypothetical protein REC12_25840 [Desulfosporosinus sp. PR]|uniref:hypothetical protein n=1 Tax=Candidatus Desulfosporosinus nitrosoreducens TaxID=3401928 RepID=UPI0027F96CD8|nr:hypothetical protein [Desulfosporosinus sp. PR]MDQ7097021.1 hypothetical protein [Desulfosporosinus sp. PR]
MKMKTSFTMGFKPKQPMFTFFNLIIILIVVLAGCGQIPESTAAGSQLRPNSVTRNEKNLLTSIHMVDDRIGWAYTRESVFRTVDGGASWAQVTPQGQANLPVSSWFCLDEQNAVLAFAQETSPGIVIWRTTNCGQNWDRSEISTGSNLCSDAELSFADAEHGCLLARYGAAMGSESDELFQTADGGATWKSIASASPALKPANGLPFAGIKNGLVFSGSDKGWLTGFSHGDGIWLYRTANGGVTWTPQTLAVPSGYQAQGGSASSNPPCFFQGQKGVLPVELRGQTPALVFYLTQDGGEDWQAATPVRSSQEPFRGFHTSIIAAEQAFVSDGYELFYTADGMRSFNPVKPDIDLTGLSQLDFVSDQMGWGIIDGSLWKTQDGGHTWTQVADQSFDQKVVESSLNLNAAALKHEGDLAFTWQGLLYLLYGDTGELKQLTTSGQAYSPAWSFDGQWIAFMFSNGQTEDNRQLWLVRRDGEQIHQVQAFPELQEVSNISWSPTANVLAAEGQDGIWVIPAEGKPYQVPGTGKFSGYAGWSPDGKFLTCYSGPAPDQNSSNPQDRQDILYTFNIENGRTTRVLQAPVDTGIKVEAWWPDGKGLLYWLDPSYSASLAADGLELQSLSLSDLQSKTLSYGLVYRNWLSFLPKGQVLLVAGGNRPVWTGKSLAVCDLRTGTSSNLPNPEGSVAIDPAASPDGAKIAFVAAQNLGNDVWGFSDSGQLSAWIATRTLWIENVDASGAHPLKAAGTGIYQPEWSKDGKRIMYVRDNSLWLIGADGGNPQRIIGPFPGWEKDPFGYYGYIWHDDFAWFQPGIAQP